MATTLSTTQRHNYIDEVGRRNPDLHAVLSHKNSDITLSDTQLRSHISHATRRAGPLYNVREAELRRLLEDSVFSSVTLSDAVYKNNLAAISEEPELYCLFAHFRSP